MSASRGANDHTRTDNSRQPLDPKTAHPTDAAHAFCSSALFRAVASPASRLANNWSAVVCSTSAGAYSGLHHTCIAGSNLSLSSLYALLKPPGRASLFSRYHWYPVGGLLLVLAHSRYVRPVPSSHCEVDIHALRLCPSIHPHSPVLLSQSVSFIALYGALGFFISYCCLFSCIPPLPPNPILHIATHPWQTFKI
jgi:hypothetical protein